MINRIQTDRILFGILTVAIASYAAFSTNYQTNLEILENNDQIERQEDNLSRFANLSTRCNNYQISNLDKCYRSSE